MFQFYALKTLVLRSRESDRQHKKGTAETDSPEAASFDGVKKVSCALPWASTAAFGPLILRPVDEDGARRSGARSACGVAAGLRSPRLLVGSLQQARRAAADAGSAAASLPF